MWRNRLFSRPLSSRPFHPRRARWSHEHLENRLLLSADLAPADEVLEILGTEGNDSVLIRTIDPEAGEAPQLVVTLNGESTRRTFRPGQTILVDLLGGNDTLDAQLNAAADWDIRLGEGEDRVNIDADSRDPLTNFLFGMKISAGSGDDRMAIKYTLFLDAGEPVRGTVFDLDLATDEGNDTVDFQAEIIDTTEIAGESAAMIDVALDFGTGATSVEARVIYLKLALRAEFPPVEEASLDLLFGAGSPVADHHDLYMNIWINQSEIPSVPADSVADVLAGITVGDASIDDTSSCWIRVSQLSTGGSMVISLDADTLVNRASSADLKVRGSDVDDDVRAEIEGFANVSVDVETHGGNDSIWIDIGAPLVSRAMLDAGAGDDDVSLSVHDGTSNTILVAKEFGRAGDDQLSLAIEGDFTGIDVTTDGGSGDDELSVAVLLGDESLNSQVTVDAGGGNDAVQINLLLPAVRPVGATRADMVRIDLGEGENSLDLNILSGPPPDDSKPAEFRPAEFVVTDGSGSSTVGLLVDGKLTDITVGLGDGDNVFDMTLVGPVPGLTFDVRTGLGHNLFDLTAHINDSDKLEMYDYPGLYAGRFDGIDKGDTVQIDWLDNLHRFDFDFHVQLGQAPSVRSEAEDEVAITFIHGDTNEPVVIGILWSSGDSPPESSEAGAREAHLSVDDGDNSLPAVQVNVRGWDFKSKDEITLEFAGALADLDIAAVTGDGDDTVDASIVGEFAHVVVNIDTGDGNDTIDVNVSGPIDVVTGAGSGAPHVKTFTGATSAETQSFFAYDPSYTGGVRVATGDVNGDGFADIITGAGPGGGPHVKVFDGRSQAEIASFPAYGQGFTGGVFVAAGDVNGDGFADIITGNGSGAGPYVKVFDGRTNAEIRSFFAYSPTFTGGVRVAAGDVNGDGLVDIITGAGPGAGPHVKVFDGRTSAEIRSFFAYDPAFRGGVFVAAGDINGDGFDDIVTGTDAGGPAHVKVISGATGATLRSFFAFDASFTGGVRVAAGDVNGDGFADIVTGAGPGSGPHVRVFDGATGAILRSFFAYDPSFAGGVHVVVGDLNDFDTKPPSFDLDLATGAGDDHAGLTFITGRSRSDSINADMGTGADSFVLNWQGALQDPAVDLQATVNVDPGGADDIPGADDLVQLTFRNGDPERPANYSWAWLARRPRAGDTSLLVEIASARGLVDVSTRLEGGSSADSVRLAFEGKLRAGSNPQSTSPVRALLDMGEGDDQVEIDLSKLSVEGSGKGTPISLDLLGGTGSNTLLVTATPGADSLAITSNQMVLEGAGLLDYNAFQFIEVNTLDGNDTVTMTSISPGTTMTIDGGAGRDRFTGRFGPAAAGRVNLLNFELITIVGGNVTFGPVAVRLVSEQDEEDDLVTR